MTPSTKKWVLKYKRQAGESLWASLLKARNIENPGEFFSSASVDDLHDPFLFADMEHAVNRLQKAVQARERIVVYGDYDVDGLSGAALLVHTLRMLGADVSYRVPHRRNDGYGLHKRYVEELAAEKVAVLITVDLGISCADEVALAESLGMSVIITDHHTLPARLPEAFATLHPKLEKQYPFPELSGSGVAFKLACALLTATKNEEWIPFLTDLASLGTVADCVPLLGENRTLVKLGLEQMKRSKWDGLRAILNDAGVWHTGNFSTQTIGFQIGPRLNASGRLDSPYWSLQTLLAEGEAAAEKSAKLEELNRQRQDMMAAIFEEAEASLDLTQPLIVASGPWTSGVVGLVAGRLQEKYGKPAFVMEDRGDELIGSARSLPGFHCVEALKAAEHCLLKFGGHEQAAGFHLKSEHFSEFQICLQKHAAEFFEKTPLKPILNIDLELNPEDLTLENCEKVSSFAPFGAGNETPVFLMDGVEIHELRPVGREEKHLKFSTRFGKQNFDSIAFNFGSRSEQLRAAKQLLVQLEKNEWNGRRSVQLKLVDFS